MRVLRALPLSLSLALVVAACGPVIPTREHAPVITVVYDTAIPVGSAVALLETCDDFFCPVCHGGPAASGAAGSSGMSGGQAGMSAAGMSAAGQSGSAGAP